VETPLDLHGEFPRSFYPCQIDFSGVSRSTLNKRGFRLMQISGRPAKSRRNLICLYMGFVSEGGMVSYWQSIIRKTPDSIWHVVLFCPNGKGYDVFNDLPVKYYRIGKSKNVWKISLLFFNYLRKEKPDQIIITCGINEILILPAILMSRIFYRSLEFDGVFLNAALRKAHFKDRIYWITVSIMASFHHKNTFVSHNTKKYWRLISGQAKPRPVFNKHTILSTKPESVRIGFLGRHSWEKGPDLFMETVGQLEVIMNDDFKNISFFVASEGPLTQDMQNHLNAKDVQFLGWIEKASGFLQQIDLLLVTSRYEGYPMVCLEALESGVPFLGFRVGGIPEILSEDNQKWLVTGGDCIALANRIYSFIKQYTTSYNAYFHSQKRFYYDLENCDKDKIEKEWIYLLLNE
jgi:glycosyltransferase involved in cell wall biosynthesis